MTQKNEMSACALKMEELEMVNGGKAGKKKHRHYDEPWVPDIYRKNPLAPRI